VTVEGRSIRILADDPEAVAPAVVRAIVGAGGEIVDVTPERRSLEAVYFDVMGVRPGAGDVD
jgi:hypothetical protein